LNGNAFFKADLAISDFHPKSVSSREQLTVGTGPPMIKRSLGGHWKLPSLGTLEAGFERGSDSLPSPVGRFDFGNRSLGTDMPLVAKEAEGARGVGAPEQVPVDYLLVGVAAKQFSFGR
jgi:hypothetical protein